MHYRAKNNSLTAIEVSNERNIDLFAHLFLLAGDGHVDELALDTLVSRKSRVLFFRDGAASPLATRSGVGLTRTAGQSSPRAHAPQHQAGRVRRSV